jgi:hypothetical protein
LFFREKRKFHEISSHENCHFRENSGIPNMFAIMLTKLFVFVNIFVKVIKKIWNFHEIYVIPTWSYPDFLVQFTNKAALSSTTYLGCPVPDVPSKMSCPDPSLLSPLSCPCCPIVYQLPCPGHFVHCSPDPLSCPGSPVISVLSRLTCTG